MLTRMTANVSLALAARLPLSGLLRIGRATARRGSDTGPRSAQARRHCRVWLASNPHRIMGLVWRQCKQRVHLSRLHLAAEPGRVAKRVRLADRIRPSVPARAAK